MSKIEFYLVRLTKIRGKQRKLQIYIVGEIYPALDSYVYHFKRLKPEVVKQFKGPPLSPLQLPVILALRAHIIVSAILLALKTVFLFIILN